MGNVQFGGGSRPIKTIQNDIAAEGAKNPGQETDDLIKYRNELILAMQRKGEIEARILELQKDVKSIEAAELDALVLELAGLKEGDESEEDLSKSNTENNAASLNGIPNNSETIEPPTSDSNLSVDTCKQILKHEIAKEGSDESESGSVMGSLFSFVFSIFQSSYWAPVDEEICKEILKEDSRVKEEPRPHAEAARLIVGGRRHTHKNRQSQRKTRKH